MPDLDRQDARERAAEAVRRRDPAQPAAERPRHLPAPLRLQRGDEDAGRGEPEVRPLTLPHKTYEGRTVEGIEITTNPDNARDGKPVFLQMGVHHAREWPSGEHAIEWAYELINGYKAGDPRSAARRAHADDRHPDRQPRRLQRLPRGGRAAQGAGGGRGGNDTTNIAASRTSTGARTAACPATRAGGRLPAARLRRRRAGVDPNRNYGGFWGGPGAERRSPGRGLPRPRPVLRARDAEHPRSSSPRARSRR